MESPEVWAYLLDGSADSPRSAAVDVEELPLSTRIAAVRLLGMKRDPVFRPILERTLLAEDGRMRLAAAESFGTAVDPVSLPVLARAVATEKHPVVAQALVESISRILSRHGSVLDEPTRDMALRNCFKQMGRLGWRNDLGLVILAREHPFRDSIPQLIRALRGGSHRIEDPVLSVINKSASPILSFEAWTTLKAVTGAIVPEDSGRWAEFWDREQDRVTIRKSPPRARSGPGTTASQGFFGIPVLGRDVVFVIDTSGSMNNRIQLRSGPGTSSVAKRMSQLDAAKKQVLSAVQGMNEESHYRLVTFADDLEIRTSTPVSPGRETNRALTNALGQIKAKGSTNLFAALRYVFSVRRFSYGRTTAESPDEIFILSDGAPTTGELTDPEVILAVVQELNRYQKTRINTVYSGAWSPTAEFMQRLAGQNQGVFVHR
jgi:hypothetical protein